MLYTSDIDWQEPINRGCPLNDGLVSWYLAGPAQGRSTVWRDLNGRNHGTFFADTAPAPTWVPGTGRPGGFGALAFDGDEDYVNLGSNPYTEITAPITITAWIYMMMDTTSYTGIVVRTSVYNEANSMFAFYLGSGGNSRKLQFIMGGPPVPIITDTNLIVPEDKWTFVAISATTSQTIFARDQFIQSLDGIEGSPPYSGDVATIGAWYNAGNPAGPFKGQIDDVRIFNRALSATELQQLYHESRLGHPDTLRRLTRRYFLVPEYITPTTPTLVTAGSLGLIRMDQPGGTTHSVGIQNGGLLQRYFDGGFREQRLPLMIETGGWGIAGTIDLRAQDGLKIEAQGQAGIRHEGQHLPGCTGGGPGRLVWIDRDSQVGPMLRYRGYGWVFEGLNLYGNYNADSLANLIADTAHRVDVGLLVEGRQSGIGTGKIIADALGISLCKTAIQIVIGPNAEAEDNADQHVIGRLVTQYCDVGMLVQNFQALGINIQHYEAGNVGVAFEFERGGKLICHQLALQAGCQVGLKLTGDTTGIGTDQSSFHFGEIQVDGSAPVDCLMVQSTAVNAARVFIGSLNVSHERAYATPAPLFDMRRYETLIVNSGENCFPGMVKVTGGIDTHFPTIVVRNCRFRVGSDLNDVFNLFDAAASGLVQVLFENNWELANEQPPTIPPNPPPPPPVNGGEFYRNFRGLLDLDGPAILSGGYADRADAGAYTPALTHVTNVADSTPFPCQYLRVGDTVTVSGKVNVEPEGAGAAQLGIALPILPDFGSAENCAGAASSPDVAGLSAAIRADATNNRAIMEWIAVDASNRSFFFTFTYRVI